MKRYLPALLFLPVLFFLLYGVVFAYDLLFGNADGVVSRVYFHRLFLRIFTVLAFLGIFYYLAHSKKGWVKVVAGNVLMFVAFALVFEFLAFLYAGVLGKSGQLPSHVLWYDDPRNEPYTTEDRRFWGDIDPVIGRWRPGNKRYVETSCYDRSVVVYETNSYGARDQEWVTDSTAKIVFLGDSFSEGVLINEKERLSELLEESSGITHMNLGILGANPLAYYLAYRKLVESKFSHKGIIVGIYVGNDFDSFGFPATAEFVKRPIYRPYWNHDSTRSEILYSLKRDVDSYESFYIQEHRSHLRQVQDSVYQMQSLLRKGRLELETNSYLLNLIQATGKKMALRKREHHYVGLYENPGWDSALTYDFRKTFDTLLSNTGDLPVLLVLIPDVYDILSFRDGQRENRYTPYLKQRYESERVWVLDLLPGFVASDQDLDQLYIPCDGHWSADGNRFAFDYIMRQPEYLAFSDKVKKQRPER